MLSPIPFKDLPDLRAVLLSVRESADRFPDSWFLLPRNALVMQAEELGFLKYEPRPATQWGQYQITDAGRRFLSGK